MLHTKYGWNLSHIHWDMNENMPKCNLRVCNLRGFNDYAFGKNPKFMVHVYDNITIIAFIWAVCYSSPLGFKIAMPQCPAGKYVVKNHICVTFVTKLDFNIQNQYNIKCSRQDLNISLINRCSRVNQHTIMIRWYILSLKYTEIMVKNHFCYNLVNIRNEM